MRRSALYSSSRSQTAPPVSPENAPARRPGPLARLRRWLVGPAWSDPRLLWGFIGALAIATAASLMALAGQMPRALTQKDIDGAVLKTLETVPLPSKAAKAFAAIAPSVVRVTGFDTDKKTGELVQRSVGTGVVIVDKGIILTNLHVVQGASVIRIEFNDGLETTASVTGVQPENDLAVLQAHKIPDDLNAATLRSTADLMPGDEVVAVGFPFGIGPSVSAGVVSGLGRSFRSPEGRHEMRNLIQFDAAANPGNSGGPLVTMDGQVVGIVTAIYNPSQQRTFIGIGFAVPIESAASAVGIPPF
jgi:S1-C subfamily serine protease